MTSHRIRIIHAAENNLKNVSVDIPARALTVFAGPSGSGKSSLVYDTVYQEGRRRYLKSLSSAAFRHAVGYRRPEVQDIQGLTPTVALRQNPGTGGRGSTVGTITETYSFLRMFFAAAGQVACASCEQPVRRYTRREIVDELCAQPEGLPLIIMAPVRKKGEGNFRQCIDELRQRGFVRVRIHGDILPLEQAAQLPAEQTPAVHVVIDRLPVQSEFFRRIEEDVQTALEVGGGMLSVLLREREKTFSCGKICANCGHPVPVIFSGLFSGFTSSGACPECSGQGRVRTRSQKKKSLSGKKEELCPACNGTGLSPEALSVTVNGMTVHELAQLEIRDLKHQVRQLAGQRTANKAVQEILGEIQRRADLIMRIGLDYLSLCRRTSTLSGGEFQRCVLVRQLAASTGGMITILDEPTVGMHPSETAKLLRVLDELVAAGNTVLVVEHDPAVISHSDHIVELGPGAGEEGGNIIFTGSYKAFIKSSKSVTAAWLKSRKEHPRHPSEIQDRERLLLREVRRFNLNVPEISFPAGCFSVITGVSGSGKSTMLDVLEDAFNPAAHGTSPDRDWKGIAGGRERIQRVIRLGQARVGSNSRSTPATYTGLMARIARLFSLVRESRFRGYGPSRFLYNTENGQCPECRGKGKLEITADYLTDSQHTCQTCGGQRYDTETLEIQYRKKTIADVLDMTVHQALEFFDRHPAIARVLGLMSKTGIGYIRLGQPLPSLSGGESQRLKIAAELGRHRNGSGLFLLDEPTTGLHPAEIDKIIGLVRGVAENGNTVIAVEHNPQFIENAEYVVELGPGGGQNGGQVLGAGSVEQIRIDKRSLTGKALRRGFTLNNPKPPADKTGTADRISIRGACENNLQSLNLDIDIGSTTAITGPDGSGKTSLVIKTIFRESRRQYMESLGRGGIQLMGRIPAPDVRAVFGLLPAVAITPYAGRRCAEFSLLQYAELQDYLIRLLTVCGGRFCPHCKIPMKSMDPSQAAEQLIGRFSGREVMILFQADPGIFSPEKYIQSGFLRCLAGGEIVRIDALEKVPLESFIVVDRIRAQTERFERIRDSIDQAYRFGKQRAYAECGDHPRLMFSRSPACTKCGTGFVREIHTEIFTTYNGRVSDWRDEALSVRLLERNIHDICCMTVKEFTEFLKQVNASNKTKTAEPFIHEMRYRAEMLDRLGLGNTRLDSGMSRLSSIEQFKAGMVRCLSNRLSGILYIVDDIFQGMHPLDIQGITKEIQRLSTQKNTVLVAGNTGLEGIRPDRVIALGPGSGEAGGAIVSDICACTEENLRSARKNIYGSIPLPATQFPDPDADDYLKIECDQQHFFQNQDLRIPFKRITAICGPAGSGKTLLCRDAIHASFSTQRGRHPHGVVVSGRSNVETCRYIRSDVSDGGTDSIPATVCGIFDLIRELFSRTRTARIRGFSKKDFSFHSGKYACEKCRGQGQVIIDMVFLPGEQVVCDKCRGRRFQESILDILYRGRNIAQVLEMTFSEAAEFFNNHSKLHSTCRALTEAGLGDIPLGRPISALTQNERSRMTIAALLSGQEKGDCLYILENVSRGFNPGSTAMVLGLLRRTVDSNNTVVVIDNDPVVLWAADHIVELERAGPETGRIRFSGTRQELLKDKNSKIAGVLLENQDLFG